MSNKDKILYILTILSFSSINFLNVSYSFLKRFIEKDFEMSSTQIGFSDALKFFGTIFGLVFYINLNMVKRDRILTFYCLSIILNGLSMGFIPFLSFLGQNGKWSVFLFNFLGGLTKAPSWSLLLHFVKETLFVDQYIPKNSQQMNEYLDSSRECAKSTSKLKTRNQNDKSFIVWTAFTLLGNIFGLVLQQSLIYKFHLRWQVCLAIPIVCIILSAVMLNRFYHFEIAPELIEKKTLNADIHGINNSFEGKSLILKCLETLFLTKNCLFTWSIVLILSIHSVMMMFLPLFLYKIGYYEYEGYILAWYNLAVILGTLVFTYLDFQHLLNIKFLIVPENQPEFINNQEIIQDAINAEEQNETESKWCFEIVNLISLLLLVLTCILLICLPCPYSSCRELQIMREINSQELGNNYMRLEYFVILGLFGFFLGGPLNKYESTELISVLQEYQQTVNKIPMIHHQVQEKKSNSPLLKNQLAKIFIGCVQILSYLTVMFFLILIGHIIQTNILAFFQLIGILCSFIFILEVAKMLERKFGNEC